MIEETIDMTICNKYELNFNTNNVQKQSKDIVWSRDFDLVNFKVFYTINKQIYILMNRFFFITSDIYKM